MKFKANAKNRKRFVTNKVNATQKKRPLIKTLKQQMEEKRLLLHEDSKKQIEELKKQHANVCKLLTPINKLKYLRMYLVFRDKRDEFAKRIKYLESGQYAKDYLLTIDTLVKANSTTSNHSDTSSVLPLTNLTSTIKQPPSVSTQQKLNMVLDIQRTNEPHQLHSESLQSPFQFMRHPVADTLCDPSWQNNTDVKHLCSKCKQPLREGDNEGLIVCETCSTTISNCAIYSAIDFKVKKQIKRIKPKVTSADTKNVGVVKVEENKLATEITTTKPIKTQEIKSNPANQQQQTQTTSIWQKDPWKLFDMAQKRAAYAGARIRTGIKS